MLKYSGMLANAMIILPFSIIILFFVLSVVTSFAFSDLDWEIKEIGLMTEPQSLQKVRLKLDRWKQKHALVSQTVGQINQCFGTIILITIANCFVAFIINSYEIVKAGEVGNYLGLSRHCMILFNNFFIITMVTYAPNRIKTEVNWFNLIFM